MKIARSLLSLQQFIFRRRCRYKYFKKFHFFYPASLGKLWIHFCGKSFIRGIVDLWNVCFLSAAGQRQSTIVIVWCYQGFGFVTIKEHESYRRYRYSEVIINSLCLRYAVSPIVKLGINPRIIQKRKVFHSFLHLTKITF